MVYVLGFGSAHNALKAESILKDASIRFRLLPAPKAFEAYCGLVIEVEEGVLEKALGALSAAGLAPRSRYKKVGDEYVKV